MMNIKETSRGFSREISPQTHLPLYVVSGDGGSRVLKAADVGVEMWDYFRNDCKMLNPTERNAALCKEFGMSQPSAHLYMKIAIIVYDDEMFLKARPFIDGGIYDFMACTAHMVNLKAYFNGRRNLPFAIQ